MPDCVLSFGQYAYWQIPLFQSNLESSQTLCLIVLTGSYF